MHKMLSQRSLSLQHSGKKMTLSQFASNLEAIDIKLHKGTIKVGLSCCYGDIILFLLQLLYDDIRKNPLEWAQ